MMESFKFLYLEACENLNTNPCEKLLSRIEDVGNSNSFNLLGIQLTNETCKAFGQALNKDVHIQELDCSNCMFSEEVTVYASKIQKLGLTRTLSRVHGAPLKKSLHETCRCKDQFDSYLVVYKKR
ncbi:leucine-rich repeat-containing protein 45 [Trichonephila clavipes]|nr:leucine-rich repeat-containing protein 45 [Trichonephila clavipes]